MRMELCGLARLGSQQSKRAHRDFGGPPIREERKREERGKKNVEKGRKKEALKVAL